MDTKPGLRVGLCRAVHAAHVHSACRCAILTDLIRSGQSRDRPVRPKCGSAVTAPRCNPCHCSCDRRGGVPASLVDDVLAVVGSDPDEATSGSDGNRPRRRTAGWPMQVITAWDRQCAFCGFDGQLGMGSVGLEAAHVRWFNIDGPNHLDNGLALCALHHKLFDSGALGLSSDYRIQVSTAFSARTEAGRRVYELVGKSLRPRPGTPLPARDHINWHTSQVFKGMTPIR